VQCADPGQLPEKAVKEPEPTPVSPEPAPEQKAADAPDKGGQIVNLDAPDTSPTAKEEPAQGSKDGIISLGETGETSASRDAAGGQTSSANSMSSDSRESKSSGAVEDCNSMNVNFTVSVPAPDANTKKQNQKCCCSIM